MELVTLLAGLALGWLITRRRADVDELVDVEPSMEVMWAETGGARWYGGEQWIPPQREFYTDLDGHRHPILPTVKPEGTAS